MDGVASRLHHENATPSQALEHAKRRERLQRLHRFAPASPIPVSERLPGPAFVKRMPPIPDEEIKQAAEMVLSSHRLNGEPRVEFIQRAVLDEFPKVTLGDLKSVRRTADVVRPRQIAMYLSKTLTTRSFPDIGRRFGGRDHTTVIHAVNKITKLIETDPAISTVVEKLRKAVS